MARALKPFLWIGLLVGAAVSFAGGPLEHEPLAPLPPPPALEAAQVKLGGRLFAEKRLSKDRTVACTSCHDLARGGDDHRPRSLGVGGLMGTNAPTVFNAALNFSQFWDGRSLSMEAQVDVALLSPVAMGGDWDTVIARLQEDPTYQKAFAASYPEGITKHSVSHAIVQFERSLQTQDSRFDRFLRGDEKALSAREQEGYRKFKAFGCVACHQGQNVGGNMFQTMGVMGDFFKDRGLPETKADLGRFNNTHRDADRHVFKVPSLRNVALTAPYFHDGSAPDLPTAVRTMARYQLGRQISSEDVDLLVAFLGTLTGENPPTTRFALEHAQ